MLLVAFLAPAPARAAGLEDFGIAAKTSPLSLPLDQVKIDIAAIRFEVEVEGVDGNRMAVPQDRRDKYRYALVTLRIRKPAKLKLTIAAADLALHYFHGNEAEVAPAEGLSTFSTTLDGERPLRIPQMQGPGWVKQTAGIRATEAAEIFCDAAFALVEPDVRECWIAVGQPSTQAPFVSKGWAVGGGAGRAPKRPKPPVEDQ